MLIRILFQDKAFFLKVSHLQVNLYYMEFWLHCLKKSQHIILSSYHCSFVSWLKIRIRRAFKYTALDPYFAVEKNSENWKGHNLSHIGSGIDRFELGDASFNAFYLLYNLASLKTFPIL